MCFPDFSPEVQKRKTSFQEVKMPSRLLIALSVHICGPFSKNLVLAAPFVNGSVCCILLLELQLGLMAFSSLSPLLFAIAIEPMACLLWTSLDVTGLVRGALKEKIALYADDVLLFPTNIRSSLPATMKYVNEFGKFSGLGINWEKSLAASRPFP